MNDAVQVITIDGPSGAGKGTLSKLLAQKLGFHLLDSGALYRITALACLEHSIDLSNHHQMAERAKALDIQFALCDGNVEVLLSGKDISRAIRSEEVGMAASKVAASSLVREALLQKQRDFAVKPGLVADGRDMGTTVFPSAKNKFYLTATAKERARRRLLQLKDAHLKEVEQQKSAITAINENKVLADIILRDEQDQNRVESPLKPADDAIVIDCTDLTIEQVLAKVYLLVR